MFENGQIVMHPTSGVCKVEGITTKNITRTEKYDYYVLKPVYDIGSTTIFLPVGNNKVGVRTLLSAEEIREIINSVDMNTTLWIDNDQQRIESFHEILKSGDQKKIIKLIAELHQNEEKRLSSGKKLRIADSKILKEAEKIIHEEFAYALGLSLEETAPYIMKQLGIEIKTEHE